MYRRLVYLGVKYVNNIIITSEN